MGNLMKTRENLSVCQSVNPIKREKKVLGKLVIDILIYISITKHFLARALKIQTDRLTDRLNGNRPRNASPSRFPPLVFTFRKSAFTIAFSPKIYPKILDFRFSVLYLCSVTGRHFNYSFVILPAFVILSETKDLNTKRSLISGCSRDSSLRFAPL